MPKGFAERLTPYLIELRIRELEKEDAERAKEEKDDRTAA